MSFRRLVMRPKTAAAWCTEPKQTAITWWSCFNPIFDDENYPRLWSNLIMDSMDPMLFPSDYPYHSISISIIRYHIHIHIIHHIIHVFFPYPLDPSSDSIRWAPAAHLIHHQDHSPSALRHLLDHGAQALLPSESKRLSAQRGDLWMILGMKKRIKLLGFNY